MQVGSRASNLVLGLRTGQELPGRGGKARWTAREAVSARHGTPVQAGPSVEVRADQHILAQGVHRRTHEYKKHNRTTSTTTQ